jgi:WD40 repeat protein
MASEDATVRVWEVATWSFLSVIRGHDGPVASVAFSPDGRWIVTAGFDKTVRLWEAATGKRLAELNGFGDSVVSAAFSPNGEWLVTRNITGVVQIRGCEVCGSAEALLALSRTRVKREFTLEERQKFIHEP